MFDNTITALNHKLPKSSPGRHHHVLVVDDEQSLCRMYKTKLSRAGFSVKTAFTFDDALVYLKTEKVSTVLSDILIGERTGIELLKASMDIEPDLPVILITGVPSFDTAVKALKFGAYDYLSKPADHNDLIQTVRRGVDLYHLRKEKKRIEFENERHRTHLETLVTERTRDLARSGRIIEAARFAAEIFFKSSDWEENIHIVLQRLGESVDAGRVYILEKSESSGNHHSLKLRYEWAVEDVIRKSDLIDLENRYLFERVLTKWWEPLGDGEPVKGNADDFPEPEKSLLEKHGVFATIVVPILLKGRLWGCIGFDECRTKRVWSPAEINGLKVTAETLGAAIHHNEQTRERIRLATAIEQSGDSIIITDPDGIVQYVNPSFESISGFKRQEALNHQATIFRKGSPSQHQPDDLWQNLKNGKVWYGQFTNKRKDGTRFKEEATIYPVKDKKGKVLNFVAISRDITEKQQLETIAEAANLMENLGYIFVGIRHEIGNPINSIKMTLTVLNKNLDSYSQATVREFLERTLGEVTRVEYLLKSFKNFSLYESPEIQRININEFMEKFISLISDDFYQRGIRIESHIPENDIRGCADPRMLHQILLNLATNAADALKNTRKPQIHIIIMKEKERIIIQVRDNGCGMSSEEKAKIFTPFFTTKARGTGLGLVIVKKMLLKMNADIHVNSTRNKGTTMSISIPGAQNSESPRAATILAADMKMSGRSEA